MNKKEHRAQFESVDNSLIFDVGMHTGKDTQFYLKKGFNVVAIEANPELVKSARAYFKEALLRKKLIIYNIVIANFEGEIDFYINKQHDDWGTIFKDFALRNERFGTKNTLTRLKCTTFKNILKKHKIPYYLKIDIEGSDIMCLEALKDFNQRPKYISIEANLTSFEKIFNELSLLWNLGYKEFKMINQVLNNRLRCPSPPAEGLYVDYRFEETSSEWSTCSGLFGEETQGKWLSIEEVLIKSKRLLIESKYFGVDGKIYRTWLHRVYEIIKQEPVGWYDLHAKFSNI